MAVGNTVTDSLADSIPTMIASARIVREFAGVMPNLVDRQRLDENTGTVWNEVSMAKLSAQAVTENTELDNPQQMEDTLFSITPTVGRCFLLCRGTVEDAPLSALAFVEGKPLLHKDTHVRFLCVADRVVGECSLLVVYPPVT